MGIPEFEIELDRSGPLGTCYLQLVSQVRTALWDRSPKPAGSEAN